MCNFSSTLIVLDKKLDIVDILKLYKLESDGCTIQLVGGEHQVLGGGHGVGLVEVQGAGLVHEDSQVLGAFVGRSLDLEAVDLDVLVEGQGEDELLVAVGLEEASSVVEAVAVGVVVILVEAL